MSQIDAFIEQLGKESTSSTDRALHRLFIIYADKLPEINGYFHKAFRQTDVTGDGNMDMAIWELIHASHAFWDVFYDMTDIKKVA